MDKLRKLRTLLLVLLMLLVMVSTSCGGSGSGGGDDDPDNPGNNPDDPGDPDDPATAFVEIDGNTYTYTLPDGTVFKAMMTPDIDTDNDFPTGTGDTGTAKVPARFIMSETEVTYELWKEVYDWATSTERGADKYTFANAGRQGGNESDTDPVDTNQNPVTTVNWRDTIVWCNALTEYYNAKNGSAADLECVYTYDNAIIRDSRDSNATACDSVVKNSSAKGFRLPGSMEWEFAARYIGITIPLHTNFVLIDGIYYTKGNSASGDTKAYNATTPTVGNYAVYTGNAGSSTAEVKTKTENALNLYDMSGNVYECCFDKNGSSRISRGGAFNCIASVMPVGLVGYDTPDSEGCSLGFRICRAQ